MKQRALQILLLALVAGAFVALARRGAATPAPKRVEWPVMGTVAGLTFRCDERLQEPVRRAVQNVYEHLNERFSAWDADSELSRLSRARSGRVPETDRSYWLTNVSADVRACYQTAFDLADASGRAFNPYVGAKLRALGFSQGQDFSDFDLGAIAKGFAVDVAWSEIGRVLRAGTPADVDAPDLLIDLGGNLRVCGGVWRTGVRNPFSEGYAAVISLTNGESVATSGNYERFVERDGVRYSHILDGRTGEPVSGMAGVTVVTPAALGATLADGLSTTLFVLGPEAGMKLLRGNPQWAAAQALWIPDTPEKPVIVASPEMAARLTDAAFPVRIQR